MSKPKSKIYGCKTNPGKSRSGCGGGARVVNIDKRVQALEAEAKRKDDASKAHDKRLKDLEKSAKAKQKDAEDLAKARAWNKKHPKGK